MLASPEITWALILGFALSAMVRAVVRRSTMVRLLGNDRPRTLAPVWCQPGASSHTAGPLAVLQGGQRHRGDPLEIVSTSLVIELGVILAL